jgi:hypothetical protein
MPSHAKTALHYAKYHRDEGDSLSCHAIASNIQRRTLYRFGYTLAYLYFFLESGTDEANSYHSPMKPPPSNPEFARFTEAMKTILRVPKAEITKRVEAEKTPRKPK